MTTEDKPKVRHPNGRRTYQPDKESCFSARDNKVTVSVEEVLSNAC
jgi:hypothetical protein